VELEYAINFQVSIDGSAQTPFQFDGVCAPAAPSCNPTFNFTIYDIQSLQSGNHTLDLTLLNATGSNSSSNYTFFYFDYAVVNETDAFPTQVTSSTVAHTRTTSATPQASSTAQQVSNASQPSHLPRTSDKSIIAPVVGGILGGIGVITAIILVVLYLRRQAHRYKTQTITADNKSLRAIGQWNIFPPPVSSEFASVFTVEQTSSYISPSTLHSPLSPSLGPQATQPSTQGSNLSLNVAVLDPLEHLTAPVQQPPPMRSPSSHTSTPVPGIHQLMDESEGLILRLCNLHVSSADIVRVVAVMSGRDESTVEHARLLRRLYDLNVPSDDIRLIVDAMQRRGEGDRATRDHTQADQDELRRSTRV
jgi:hypothetical protein